MTTKRMINGNQYNVPELVQNAIVAVSSQTFDSLKSHDAAILRELAKATGAFGFEGQLGKIRFDTTDNAIADVNAYLSRRNAANHQRWTKSHNRF